MGVYSVCPFMSMKVSVKHDSSMSVTETRTTPFQILGPMRTKIIAHTSTTSEVCK